MPFITGKSIPKPGFLFEINDTKKGVEIMVKDNGQGIEKSTVQSI
jgi:hypothetical protein